MATIVATTTGDFANTIVTQSGNCDSASVTWLIPTPKAAARPTIEVFLWFISPVDTSFIPVIAMEEKTETVAPPRTHWGIVVRRAENFGTSPAIRSISAVRANTRLFTTFVVETIPTFCEYVALGSPPKRADAIFDNPYATIPLFNSFPVGSLSSPPIVVADRSPIACIALIANKIEKEAMAENSNLTPKGMKRGRENQLESPILDRSTIPKGIDTI